VSDWAKLEDVRTPEPTDSPWAAAPKSDVLLQQLLDVAEIQCRAYAPPPVLVTDAGGVTTEVVTDAMRLAVIYQAREVYAAGQRQGDTIVQGDTYVIRARPLVGSVKQLLRPSRGRRAVG
jgi:hypothetical protein